MNKYLLVGLSALLIFLIGAIVVVSSSEKPATTVLGTVSVFADLPPVQFNQELSTGKYTLIDVRTIDEYNAGHIKGAKEEDFYQTQAFSNYLDTLNKNGRYLIYCHTGRRSGLAMQIMQQKGFTSVNDLAGGYNAWVSANLPTE